MTYSDDFRWRIVSLIHVYDIRVDYISHIFGPKPRTINRWYSLFIRKGVVRENKAARKTSRWPNNVLQEVLRYVKDHPTFFLEELQSFVVDNYPLLTNVSLPTICRVLNFDLGLSRKVLTKAARECVPQEILNYKAKLKALYSFPEQMIFLDETSKDGRHAYRRYAWSRKNTPAIVSLPFSRGNRRSVFAALDFRGFVAWESIPGTFTRHVFHEAFVKHVVPLLNPWPLPRSIVVLDNAKIHLYKDLEDAIHQTGARLLFLPPFAPQLNPIETCFGLLKRWVQRYANLVFPLYPDAVLEIAMKKCTVQENNGGVINVFSHSGYDVGGLRDDTFNRLINHE
jgi:transposase